MEVCCTFENFVFQFFSVEISNGIILLTGLTMSCVLKSPTTEKYSFEHFLGISI